MNFRFFLKKKYIYLNFWQGQEECTDSGTFCLNKSEKPLFLKELKDMWKSRYCKGKYSASNTLLVDDEPHVALLNPVIITSSSHSKCLVFS